MRRMLLLAAILLPATSPSCGDGSSAGPAEEDHEAAGELEPDAEVEVADRERDGAAPETEIARDAAEDDTETMPEAEADAEADGEDEAPDLPPGFRIALSISPFVELLLDAGIVFVHDGVTADTPAGVQRIMMAHGGSEIFQRISTKRTASLHGEDRSLEQGLARAALARDLGLPYNPELGLFGTYGDVSCQTAPDLAEYAGEMAVPDRPWHELTVDEMVPFLRDYAALAAAEIVATGVTVNVWDLGNEVNLGTAGVAPRPLDGSTCDQTEGAPGWYRAPDAVDPAIGTESVLSLLMMSEAERIAWLQAHVWPHEARLLAAAAEGVRSVVPDARFSTHISTDGPDFCVAFYEAMAAGGFTVDEAGFSFYPSAGAVPGGSLTRFRRVVEAVQAALGVPAFIAEYSYPSALMSGDAIFGTWNHELAHYPLSEQGQSDLLGDLASWAAAVGMSGIRPWAPELFVADWGPMALFEQGLGLQGVPRDGLRSILEGASRPDAGALKE